MVGSRYSCQKTCSFELNRKVASSEMDEGVPVIDFGSLVLQWLSVIEMVILKFGRPRLAFSPTSASN